MGTKWHEGVEELNKWQLNFNGDSVIYSRTEPTQGFRELSAER